VNLTEPIRLSFEIPETDKELVPAYWDYSYNCKSKITHSLRVQLLSNIP